MGGTPFADEINLTDGTHPGLYGPVCFFLMGNIAFQIHKGLSTLGERTELHLQKQTIHSKTRI